MSRMFATLAAVSALTFASAAHATGSHGSFFYNHDWPHYGGHDDDDEPSAGICRHIRNPFLRHLCEKFHDDGPHGHPESP